MRFERVSILIFLLICLTIFAPTAIGQQSPTSPGRDLKVFRILLANINANFISPDGFTEIKPSRNDKFSYQYGLKLPGHDFEARFQVDELKSGWRSFEKARGEQTNPDSSYIKMANAEVKNLAGDGKQFSRSMSAKILQTYNADLGRSYFFNLMDSPQTNHYQFALMVILQKNHYGNVTVVCFGNERGPEFFKNINKLIDCFRFIN
jgi:hypothetical protein